MMMEQQHYENISYTPYSTGSTVFISNMLLPSSRRIDRNISNLQRLVLALSLQFNQLGRKIKCTDIYNKMTYIVALSLSFMNLLLLVDIKGVVFKHSLCILSIILLAVSLRSSFFLDTKRRLLILRQQTILFPSE